MQFLVRDSKQDQHLLSELRVQPKVDDFINADSRLGEHGWDGQDVERDAGLGDVASSLSYGDTGIGERGHKE